MRRARLAFQRSIISLSIAWALGTLPVREAEGRDRAFALASEAQGGAATDTPEPSSSRPDDADERLVFQALRQRWARDPSTHWLARASESEQQLWMNHVTDVGERRRKLRDFGSGPRQAVDAALREALRKRGIDAEPGSYDVSLQGSVRVGGIDVPVSYRDSLPGLCLGTEADTDFSGAVVRQGEEAVPDAQRKIVLELLGQPSCRLSTAGRLDRFKARRSVLRDDYVALVGAELRKSVLEAGLKGHLTGGRDSRLKGLDIVRDAMNGSARVETGTLMLSLGEGEPSIALPQWLVFVRKDAQGAEDGVVLYRPDGNEDGQDLYEYLDIRRLGQAVAGEGAGECAALAGGTARGSFRQVVMDAAAPGQGTAVVKFFADLCKKPTTWGGNLRFTPLASHGFEDAIGDWVDSKLDLMLKDLERMAGVPELPVLAARHKAVAERNREFNDRHLPTLREFTWRKERDKLTSYFRKEGIVADDGEVDPDSITIAFNGRTMTWTAWVLEGYRKHGDNVFAESNNFMRDAAIASTQPAIATRLNTPDVKQGVMANLRRTYAGDDYIKAVNALLDPQDPRRQASRDLRVAAQVLEMQLAAAIARTRGDIDADDYRWLKTVLEGLPGGMGRSDVEVAAFRLNERRIPGLWVVSRKSPAGPGESRSLRDSFVFVPDAPFGQSVYREGPYFRSLLRTDEFRQYLSDRALARDEQVIEDALKDTSGFRISFAPVDDFADACDEWLRDLVSDADEATTSRLEVIREQVVKGGRFANIGICTAATGGLGAGLCAAGTLALMGVDTSSAVENLRRGRRDEALWDVAFLWADAFDVGQGFKAFDPKLVLRLVGKSRFANVDEAKDALETVARQRKGFGADGRINGEFAAADVRFDQLVPMSARPGKADAGAFYEFGGKTYVVEQGRVFEVHSDNAWSTVRLRDPGRPGHAGAPVVFRHGRWQFDDGALLGGGKGWSKPLRPSKPTPEATDAAVQQPPKFDHEAPEAHRVYLPLRPSKPSPKATDAAVQPPLKFDHEAPEAHRAYLYSLTSQKHGLDSRYGSLFSGAAERQMRSEFFNLRRRLLEQATLELSLPLARRRPVIPSIPEDATQRSLVETLYRSADGLVVGESHQSISSKQFLIDNMAALKENGVETIYLEHLLHDVHQADLDTYFRSAPGTPMPRKLKDYLARQDEGHRTDPKGTYTFLRIVETAKEHHVRPVAIDVLASYHVRDLTQQPHARITMMNFHARQVIEAYQSQSPGGRWIALVGNGHANTFEDIPGVAELTGAIGLRVEDMAEAGTQSIRQDPGLAAELGTMGGGSKYVARSDLLMKVPVAGFKAKVAEAAVQVLPEEARNVRSIGSFAIVDGDDGRFLYHRSNDGKVHETRILEDDAGFYIERDTWHDVTGVRYASVDDLAEALVTLKGMSNQTPAAKVP